MSPTFRQRVVMKQAVSLGGKDRRKGEIVEVSAGEARVAIAHGWAEAVPVDPEVREKAQQERDQVLTRMGYVPHGRETTGLFSRFAP